MSVMMRRGRWRGADLSRPSATLPYEGRDQATSVAIWRRAASASASGSPPF